MNRPKEKRGLPAALKTAELTALYRLLGFLQRPLSFGFWKIERILAKLDIEIERRRS
jgi:hypothetical protein